MYRMIKKAMCCVGMLLLFLAVGWFVLGFTVYREPVHLLEGVSFGMSPWEVERVMGAPVSDETIDTRSIDGSRHRYLCCDAEILGRKAEIMLEFIPHRLRWVLLEYRIRFADSKADLALYETLTESLRQAYSHRENYRTYHLGSNIFSMELNRGQTGTGYDVKIDAEGVSLWGETNEFYR